MTRRQISRRAFLKASSIITAAGASGNLFPSVFAPPRARAGPGPYGSSVPLAEFGYSDVTLPESLAESQFSDTLAVLMEISDDSLLKPFRQMAGQAAPGVDLGGWYHYDPNYDWHTQDSGFAPACTFGQWVSALARAYAITGRAEIRDRVARLNRLYAQTICGDFYDKNRFPAYTYDKLVLGLMDSRRLAGDPDALTILEQTTKTALPYLPAHAVDRELEWRPGRDQSFRWDESYTCPENLFLAYQQGAGERYRDLAIRFLDDQTFFDPLARGENVLAGKHAYSYVNSLSSAMQAYLTLGSEKHLRAARNGFEMLMAQSFATGGWGPDELLRAPGSNDVFDSLSKTHNSFETPCGSYAHFKLTRYLLRVTRDSRYGDSMERVMYNTVLGAKPMQSDGHAFYYSDYNFEGRRVYSNHGWPCCSGTLPQVAADYRINAYFRDDEGVYVNLFLPSILRWRQGSSRLSLKQTGGYPLEESIRIEVRASAPELLSLNLRIPEWSQDASVRINGKREAKPVQAGRFHTIRRNWKDGDYVELELPIKLRLEPFDAAHPQTVAALRGPLVLFPLTHAKPRITRKALLESRRISSQLWQCSTDGTAVKLTPFVAVGDSPYTTYVETKDA